MAEQHMISTKGVWIAVGESGISTHFPLCTLVLKGQRHLYEAVAEGDWLLMLNPSHKITGIGRVLRIRSDLENTTLYLDKRLNVDPAIPMAAAGLTAPPTGSIQRLAWDDFTNVLSKSFKKTIDDIPLIDDQAYIRELLQLAITDDLLGPANGPHEQIFDMSVRDRYLVGKLAPREIVRNGAADLEGASAIQDAEKPAEELKPGTHDPGAEFSSTTGRIEPESDAGDEIDAANNQSLIPSSFGMTFCVDGGAGDIEVEVRWGRYERLSGKTILIRKRSKEK